MYQWLLISVTIFLLESAFIRTRFSSVTTRNRGFDPFERSEAGGRTTSGHKPQIGALAAVCARPVARCLRQAPSLLLTVFRETYPYQHAGVNDQLSMLPGILAPGLSFQRLLVIADDTKIKQKWRTPSGFRIDHRTVRSGLGTVCYLSSKWF